MISGSLGHYEIIESLGAGGMGEVYRARDSNLRREVAIKVLPEDLADDPERLARLEREAHLLAALNHSNIATIFSLEESEGTRFLVMELVKGQSLEELLEAGPLPIEEALDICRQIAEALEAAHEEGIIHRDLKPANVLVTPDGKAKVLDFGLAKVVETATSDTDLSHSPTITIAATEAGVIIGTAPYMCPEQVRGKRLDKRADIWAFGCVLYEVLTGQRAFSRETVADTLAAILEVEPPWDALPNGTPVAVQALLRRCLRKDRRRRLHDIADARIEIEEALGLPGADTSPIPAAVPPAPGWRRAVPWAIAAAAIVLGAGSVLLSMSGRLTFAPPSDSTSTAYRYTVEIPDGMITSPTNRDRVILSRDGSMMAYLAQPGDSSGLYVHHLDQTQPEGPFEDFARSRGRFFSHDGNWIAFYEDGRDGAPDKLKKAPVRGGAAEEICDVPGGRPGMPGGTWAPDDTIIFYSDYALWSVAAEGGEPVRVAGPDASIGETHYLAPRMIPGRNAVVFVIFSADMQFADEQHIAVLDLETGKSHRVGKTGNSPLVTPTGHLIYERGKKLYAVAFDLDSYETSGAPVPILEEDEWLQGGAYGNPSYGVSENGTLVFQPGGPPQGGGQILWVDQDGVSEAAIDDPPWMGGMRMSPDKTMVAFGVGAFNSDIWIYELGSGPLARLEEDWIQEFAAWAHDGSGFYYRQLEGATSSLHYYSLETFTAREFEPRLPEGYRNPLPYSISHDGRLMALRATHTETRQDILLLPLEGDHEAEPWLATPANEHTPMFSPNDRLIAYFSDAAVRDEGYVRAVSERSLPGAKVASGRTAALKWGQDSRSLYYFPWAGSAALFKVWKVSLGPEDVPEIGRPSLEFDLDRMFFHAQRTWEVGPDGRMLVGEVNNQEGIGRTLRVVVNWFGELNERVPTGR